MASQNFDPSRHRLPLDAKGIFWRACRDGDHVTAARLLAMGVDPASVPAGRGPSWPALFHAAGNGHLACVQELLRFGADPNALTSARQTALMSAASKARRDCIGELLKVGDPNLRDADGSTALAHVVGALFFESFSVLDAIACCELLAPLTDPDLADAEGFTPLMLAAGQGHEGLVLALAPFSRLESQNAQGNHAAQVARLAGHGGVGALLERIAIERTCGEASSGRALPRL